jgi:hypothetical protein
VPRLGFIDSVRGLEIEPILSSLGDGVNTMLRNYLKTITTTTATSSSLSQFIADLKFKGLRGRNILHTAAAAGYAPVFTTFQAFYLEQSKSNDDDGLKDDASNELRVALLTALTLRDDRGQTPVDIAKIRWGILSRKSFNLMKSKLYARNNNLNKEVGRVDESSSSSSSSFFSSDSFSLGPVVDAISELLSHVQQQQLQQQPTTPLTLMEVSEEDDEESSSKVYGVLDAPNQDMMFNHGGWDVSKWKDASDDTTTQLTTDNDDAHHHVEEEEERCDALEVSASFASTPGFSEWFFKNHLIKGVPLVIRQGVKDIVRTNLRKDNFVKRLTFLFLFPPSFFLKTLLSFVAHFDEYYIPPLYKSML